MNKIFFDLDGTLIDYSKRNYYTYKLLIKKYKLRTLPFNTYWKLKRSKTIVVDNQNFSNDFINLIESPNALKKDRLFKYSKKVLALLKDKGYELYLVSYRASRKQTILQLKSLGIYDYFTEVCLGKGINGNITKSKYIKKHIKKDDDVYVVGDTEDDILAAKKVNAISIAVLSGIRNKKILLKLNPNFIISDIRSLSKIIFDNVVTLGKNSKK